MPPNVDLDDDEVQIIDHIPAPNNAPRPCARIRLPPHSSTRSRKIPVQPSAPPISNAVNTQGTATIVISSDEETEGPPPVKRQKTAAAEPSHPSLKRKRPGPQPETNNRTPCSTAPVTYTRRYLKIDLSHMDDDIEAIPDQPPKKKQNIGVKDIPIIILDSDDEEVDDVEETESDYDNIHDGYDIGWSNYNVEPDEHIFEQDIDVVREAVARLNLHHVDPRIVQNSRILAPLPVFEATQSTHVADVQYKGTSSFRRYLPTKMRGPVYASYCGGRSRTGLLKHRPPNLQSPLARLKRVYRFQMADGIHTISQSGPKILVASSTPGGGADEDRSVNQYNSMDTLAIYTEETRERWISAHLALTPQLKYYDVTSAHFDPTNPGVFLSTGLDGDLILWKNTSLTTNDLRNCNWAPSFDLGQDDIVNRYIPVEKWGKEKYRGTCQDIIFRPQDIPTSNTVFAAPCDNGKIFVHGYSQDCQNFRLIHRLQVNPHATHSIGATVWGQQSTSNMLFVCSETDNAYHCAFNAVTGKLMYHLDQRENGEELALNPQGSELALCTIQEHLHLHLYDVARGNHRSIASISLPPPSLQLLPGTDPEVNVMSWSPDGILLAIGCNDDVVHVYDVRCLERGPVQSLVHETRSYSRGLPLLSLPEEERRTESRYCFGVTVLAWTTEACYKSPSLGLLTGGGDHCVALWDVKTSGKERRVVAELDGPVGIANFGDLSKGEKPLVAGDTDGHVYMFDFVERE